MTSALTIFPTNRYHPPCPFAQHHRSVVFAGFSSEALRDRINNAAVEVVITADEGMRGGRAIPLKKVVDEAVAQCPTVKKVRG